MAFLKTMWKNNTKHKKLNNEDLVLTTSVKDLDILNSFNDDDESYGIADDIPVVYNLKYLGHTSMTSASRQHETNEKQSKKMKMKPNLNTTSAIKRVVATSKSMKKLVDVTVSISPKGILAIDQLCDEKVIEVPIHRISYCSIDASHDTIFSFVSSPEAEIDEDKAANNSQLFGSKDSPIGELEITSLDDDDEGLVLHAFQCQKRKIAHNVTMTVARSFERAYQIYQNSFKTSTTCEEKMRNKENKKIEIAIADVKQEVVGEVAVDSLIDLKDFQELKELQDYKFNDEFIEKCSKNKSQEILQTTWVSFD